MSLNIKYLPHYSYREKHSLEMLGSPQEAMTAIMNYQTDNDIFFRYAIALRELPHRLLQKSEPAKPFSFDNFTLLEKDGDQEVILGLLGQFWKLDYGQIIIQYPAAFLAFNQPSCAKLTLSFSVQQLNTTHIRISTETRVFCLDKEALFKFRPYWYLIRPVSGFIRHRILRQIQKSIIQSRGVQSSC